MAWKCKKCGSVDDFSEQVTGGYQSNIYDENGEILNMQEQDLEYGELSCNSCGHFIIDTNDIKEIAVWEDN